MRATVSTIVLAGLAYVAIAVPVGRRTLFEHVSEIAKTQPAQDLAEDVGNTATSAFERARARLHEAEAKAP